MATYVKTAIDPETLKGTKTEQNLHTALSGESQAYLRYKWFEAKARDDGYEEIANIFAETAGNEKEHAEIWFRYLGGWSSTETNLNSAAGGEHFEWSTMYAEFEQTARDEGFEVLAQLFKKVADIERMHEERYTQYLNEVRDGKVFEAESASQKWICLNCGHVMEGKQPPAVCPVCSHSQGYFQKKS